jgi:hypothetical protein
VTPKSDLIGDSTEPECLAFGLREVTKTAKNNDNLFKDNLEVPDKSALSHRC